MSRTLLFVGSCNGPLGYARPNGQGISTYAFDDASGAAALVATSGDIVNPTYVTLAPDGRALYAVSEYAGAVEGRVNALAIGPQGKLSFLNSQPSRGCTTAMLSLDRSRRFVLGANYSDAPATIEPNASVFVLPIGANGDLAAMTSEAVHVGAGPDRERQERSHPHCVRTTPDNRFVFAADLGIDRIVVYRFDAETGALARHGEAELPPETGPRHIAVHPELPRIYVSGELNSKLVTFGYDDNGRLELLGLADTLPPDWSGMNHCSEVALSPDAGHVYVGNRGHDSLAHFRIDEDGLPTDVAFVPSGGRTPRHFAFHPSGRFLAVANQDSDVVSLFAVEAGTGALAPLTQRIETGSPTSVAFLELA